MLKRLLVSLRRSPALSEELARYDIKIKKEYKLRLIGLILSIAIVPMVAYLHYLNSSTIFVSQSDLIPVGISTTVSKTEIIKFFDSNNNSYRSIVSALAIDRDELTATVHGSWNSDSSKYLWNLKPMFSSFEGEKQMDIDYGLIIYGRPANLVSNQNVSGWIGNSNKIGWFGIDEKTGNIYTEKTALDLAAPPDTEIQYSLTATNLKNQNPNTKARPGDLIEYSLQAINNSSQPKLISFRFYIGDIIEYASPTLDLGGAVLDNQNSTVSWPDVIASPGSTESRLFTVKIKDPIPTHAQSKIDKLSFNCSLEAVYGNSTKVTVDCPKLKQLEIQFNELPSVGKIASYFIISIYLLLVITLFHRTRSIKKTVAKIKHELHQGPLS